MKRFFSSLRVASRILLMVATSDVVAAAGGDWKERPAFAASPSALLEAVAALPPDKRSEVAVMWSEAAYSIDAQGRSITRRHVVYRLARTGSRESDTGWNAVRVEWAPWYQDRPKLRARVVSPDGRSRNLEASTVVERAAELREHDIFSDARVLEAPLPGLVDGAIVELETVVRDREPFFAAGSAYRETPLAAPYVQAGRVTVEAARGLPLHWKVEGKAPVRESDRTEGRLRKLRFEYGPLSLPEHWQTSVPPEERTEPAISFGTARDWASVAQAYATIVEAKLSQARMDSFVPSKGQTFSREQAIDLVLARIYENVRYTGLELGSQMIVPVKPEETLRRGYGDCKDQAILAVAALRHLGVAARVALLRPGFYRDVHGDVPGLGLFTHAIVLVPGQPAYWIDPTLKFARFQDLPDADLDRQALVVASDTTGLVKTPAAALSGRREKHTREVFLEPSGKGKLIETTEFFGVAEAEARGRYEGHSEKTLREGLEAYAKDEFLSAKLDRIDVASARDLSQPFRLRLEMSESGRVIADASEAVVAIMTADLLRDLPWELAQALERRPAEEREPAHRRTLPYRLQRAADATLRYVIHLPAGMIPRDAPSSSEVNYGPILVSRRVEHPATNRVEVEVRLVIKPATLSVEKFEEVARRLPQLGEDRVRLIYFDQEVAKLLADGAVGSALSLARRLVANESHQAFRRGQLALALLAAGLGDAACREAERATSIEPKSSSAFQTLGWCYQHDSIGRRYGAGFPREKSIAAYRKAVELDPKNTVALGDLAILLEHDAQGRRYGPGLDLREPIALYRSLEKQQAQPGLRQNLHIVLLQSGQAKEALDLLPREGLDLLGWRLRLVALVLERGLVPALAEARQVSNLPTERSAVLRGAGLDLLGMRRFSESAEFLKAAATDASNAAELLRFAGLVEQASKWRTAPDSPEQRVIDFFDGFTEAGYHEKLRERIAPEVIDVLGADEAIHPRSEFDGSAMLRAASRSLGLEPGLLMELALRSANYKQEGDAGFGYRISLETQFGSGTRSTLYFVPTSKGLRVAVANKPTGALGVLALKADERGDGVSAGRWLDWAYSEDERWGTNSIVRRLWSPGKPDQSMRLRAALALVVEAGAGGGLPDRLRREAKDADSAGKIAIELALARGAMIRKDPVSALRSIEALSQEGPDSPEIHFLKVGALQRLKRWDDLKQLGESLNGVSGKENEGKRVQAVAEFGAGNFPQAISLVEELAAGGKANQGDLNQAAWATLFTPGYNDKAMRWAQRAAEMTRYQRPTVLNTLAAIYAWQGKPREAYRLMIQTLEIDPGNGPSASDWLVLGRISEDYGLADEATQLYQRAIKEDDKTGYADGLSNTRLAQLQLERLKKQGQAR